MAKTKSIFGPRLRALRKRSTYTQEELAARAGITTTYLAMLERGERESPSWEIVVKLAESLGVSTEEFR
jgi:transcriptional regulator with XRE-family HTH domain